MRLAYVRTYIRKKEEWAKKKGIPNIYFVSLSDKLN